MLGEVVSSSPGMQGSDAHDLHLHYTLHRVHVLIDDCTVSLNRANSL